MRPLKSSRDLPCIKVAARRRQGGRMPIRCCQAPFVGSWRAAAWRLRLARRRRVLRRRRPHRGLPPRLRHNAQSGSHAAVPPLGVRVCRSVFRGIVYGCGSSVSPLSLACDAFITLPRLSASLSARRIRVSLPPTRRRFRRRYFAAAVFAAAVFAARSNTWCGFPSICPKHISRKSQYSIFWLLDAFADGGGTKGAS